MFLKKISNLFHKNKKSKTKSIEEQSLDEIIADIEKEKSTKKEYNQKRKRKSGNAKEKKENKERVQKNKKLLSHIELTSLDLIPFKRPVDNGETGIETVDGKFFNIYRIESADLNSCTDDELLEHIITWDKHYRTSENDEKIIAINMPVSVADNIRFLRKKLNKTQNPLYREKLEECLYEFTDKMRGREDKEFYIVIYAETYEEMLKLNARFEGSMVSRGFATDIEYEQKLNVFRKFFNPFNDVLKPINN